MVEKRQKSFINHIILHLLNYYPLLSVHLEERFNLQHSKYVCDGFSDYGAILLVRASIHLFSELRILHAVVGAWSISQGIQWYKARDKMGSQSFAQTLMHN